jgi:glycosyltransferase involved in cell wall biosynthesis
MGAIRHERATPANTLIIIPAYNESGTIGTVVNHLRALGFSQIRVVDNASIDGTAQVARSAGASIVTETRKGYGSACWAGYREPDPRCQWILFCDADGSDDLEKIPTLMSQSANYEFVLGDRRSQSGGKRVMTVPQYYGNGLAVMLIRWGWGFRYTDLGPMRLIQLDALRRLEMRDRGFGWTVEMQIRAVEEGLRILEFPVGYFERRGGRSKISGTVAGTVKAGSKILWIVFQSFLRRVVRRFSTRQPIP